ncbi:MAG: tyrosine-type recombinase/integrase [Anaerolineae bacterium]|nr:tyrosine-type recombinase/integrase [Anaerolineae bacterium]
MYLWQMVKRYAERAGLEKDVRPHTLRHSAATTWLRQGFNLREVQKLLGHSSPATTEVYTHVFDEDLQRKQSALTPLAL